VNKIRSITVIAVIVGGIAIVTIFGPQNGFVKNTTSYIIKPIGSIFSGAGWWINKKVKFFTSIGDLKIDNQKLFNENLELRGKIAKLSEVEKENDILRKEMSLAPRGRYELEAAMIIGRESGDYSEVIHVNKGQNNQVEKGMAVLVGKGILIGQVIDVSTNTAKIQLITDKNFKVNAKLVESDGYGVVFGQYGTSARMKMIPQTVEINKGEAVVTSRLSDNFKEDLLIGYVQEVFDTADGLFQEVIVLLPKELEELHLVQILKK